MAMINQRAGRCSTCPTSVAPGTGVVDKVNGKWLTFCAVCGAGMIDTRRELAADGTVRMPYNADHVALVKSAPGARWNPDAKLWTVSLKACDRRRVLEIADQLALQVAPELRAVEEDADAVAAVERARAAGAYDYQLDGVRFLAERPRALLGDDMGLGKTMQTLMSLPANGHTLVVCPASLKLNWRNEVRRWRPDLTPVVLKGKGSLRAPEAGEVLIINYDILPTDMGDIRTARFSEQRFGELAGEGTSYTDATVAAANAYAAADNAEARALLAKTRLVVDEAHRCKSSKAKRTKAVKALGEVCVRITFLTGTPLLGRPFDLWGTLSAGDMAREVFGGWKGFLKCFGAYDNDWGGIEFTGPDRTVPERLRRVMLRRTKAEVLTSLPPKVYSEVPVGIDGTKLATELDRAWDAWAESVGEDPDTTDELPNFTMMSAVRARLAEAKTAAAISIIEDHEEQGAPLLVFSAHRAPVEEIGKREGWGIILGGMSMEERQQVVDAFQAGQLKGVAMTIGAGGVGLTLTRASTVLFVDLDWTPGNNVQAEDRAHRIGQTGSAVQIIHLVVDHAVDRRVCAILRAKQALIEGAIERRIVVDAREAETTFDPQARMRALTRLAELEADRREAIEDAAAEQDRTACRARVARRALILRAESPELTEIQWTPELMESVRGAIDFLASVCDGAQVKDGAGFNKIDAARGRWLAVAGMDTDDAMITGLEIARRYPRQLREMFPALFRA